MTTENTLPFDYFLSSQMEKIRDECLVAIQKVLSKHNMGAGKTLNEFKKKIESINKKS